MSDRHSADPETTWAAVMVGQHHPDGYTALDYLAAQSRADDGRRPNRDATDTTPDQ